MKLVYDINDRPPLKKNLIFALQQLLAIMAATLLVPILVNGGSVKNYGNDLANYMSQPAALLGAGFGTLFYIFMTKKKSPVFLGSSFAFINPLIGATAFGYLGIFMGAVFAGLVYVVIALIVKKTGAGWINKLMPPVVIGPTVALIGLSLCGSAVNNLNNTAAGTYNLVHILVGIIAFFITVYASTKGSKGMKLIPFVIGILGAYVIALALTGFGYLFNCDYIKLVNLSAFEGMKIFEVPHFNFLGIFGVDNGAATAAFGMDFVKNEAGEIIKEVVVKNGEEITRSQLVARAFNFSDMLNVLLLFAPVALVVLAEHIADHKNLSTIINRDLTEEPGLHRTLVGDGIGSVIGSFFGGCPNTTYGESVGCVAITGNASVSTIVIAALYCIVLAFFGPFTAFVNSIPTCITGGVCIALYGFIAVSGLKMVQKVDLNDNRNLFVVAAILVPGIGGLELKFGPITISAIATALILGILVNVIFNKRTAEEKAADAE